MIKQTGDGGNFTSAQAVGRIARVFAKLPSARSLACATMEAFPIVQFLICRFAESSWNTNKKIGNSVNIK